MKKQLLLFSVPLLMLGMVLGYSFVSSSEEKAMYVDGPELYNGFTLTQELELKLESVQNNRMMLLDSLRMQVESIGRQLEQLPDPTPQEIQYFEQLRNEYFYKEEQFAGELDRLSQTYNEQIWNQLNQFTKEFGKERGYDFIYGATGDGSLMYANEEKEVTDELILFVNEKYSGQ